MYPKQMEKALSIPDESLGWLWNAGGSVATMKEGNEGTPPDVEDIEDIIPKPKNNKAPGIDWLCAELFKTGGQVLV